MVPKAVWTAQTVVCLMTLTVAASAQIVEDGLIGYWSFDPGEVTGTTVTDGTGNNDAQIVGSVPLVAGQIGDAVEFDGSEENFVSVDNPDSFDFNSSFSWNAWISTVDGGSVVAKTGGPGTDGQGPKTLFVIGGALTFDTGWVGQFSGSAVADGEWHHVGVTVEVGDGPDPVQLYIDGAPDALDEMNVNEFPPEPGELVMIGLDGRADLEFPPFTGIIDEVGIYNRVLTADEMAQNFASTTGLVAAVDAVGKVTTIWADLKASR